MNKNNFELMLRHRPDYREPIENKHTRFLSNLKELNDSWSLESLTSLDDIGEELILVTTLDDIISKKINGFLSYSFRSESYLEDNAQYDDSFIIKFNIDVINLKDVVSRILPIYIKAFDCYRATIQSLNIANQDWQKIAEICNKTNIDANGRDGIYRINAINYFDEELCKRAFNLSPKTIVKRLIGKVESVSLLNGGVYLIYNSEILSTDELLSIDNEVRSYLKKGWLF